MPLKFMQSVSTIIFSVNGVNLYIVLDWTDYLELKVADLNIDFNYIDKLLQLKQFRYV